MANTEHNPPAFPLAEHAEGMTMRDYFAATVINGIISNEGRASTPDGILDDVKRAYQYADAMLEARKTT